MKKVLSLVLVVTVVFISISQGLIVFAEDEYNYDNIHDFADDLSRVIRENKIDDSSSGASVLDDVLFKMDHFIDNMQSSSIYDELHEDAFETKRLIVKADHLDDYQGAIDCVSGYKNLYILQYESQLDAKKAYEHYLTRKDIDYVEPDTIYTSTEEDPGIIIPSDEANEYDDVTAAAIKWLSDKVGFSDIKEKLAQKIEDDYVLVAVIDSGVDTDHELLVDRLVESDVNLSGSGNQNSVEDDYGHGTHVAGIVAMCTLDNVSIKPYKVLNNEGKGSLSTIAVAVDMAVLDGADVINISISGKNESPTLTESIDNATENDINVVVAAGNNNYNLDNRYVSPACIESAITVSATDRDDKKASFSNYNGTIDICAPGVDIESSYLNNTYIQLSGTSMAAPQVSAGLAIVQSISLDISAEESEEKIKDFAIKLVEEEGKNYFGAGLLSLKYLVDGKPTTANPVFSVESGTFEETFTVEITCADEDAEIYYVIYDTDLESVNWFDSFKYDGPITVSYDMKISAVAWENGALPSDIVTVEYDRIAQSEEDYYEINSLGYITNYYGSEADVVVPDVIKGIKVNGIGIGAFKDNKRTKNIILPDSCTNINSAAFKDCTALVSISGSGIKTISANAFENSSVQTVDFPNLKTIGMYAFAGCSNLNSVTFSNVETIGAYAFTETPSLGVVICDNLTELGTEAFAQSGVSLFSAQKLISTGNNVFADCVNLVSASIPQLTVLSLGTFKNCTALNQVELPALTEIKANAFRNSAIEGFVGMNVESIGNYAFAENAHLTGVMLPKVTTTGTYVFSNCTSLQVVNLAKLVEVNSNSFSYCESLKALVLPSVVNVLSNAFKNSYIEYLMFYNVESINSLPDTLKGITLPETAVSISATPSSDFTVYGFEDTYAQTYATKNNKKFDAVPVIFDNSSEYVTTDKKYIVIFAMGYGMQYQWYKNDIVSNVGGTPIEGATYFFYEPSPDDDCAAYYCVVTSSHNGYSATEVSSPILNAAEYRKADYSKYNKLQEEIYSLNRVLYDEELLRQLDELVSVDMTGLKLSQQDVLDNYVQQLEEMLTLVKESFVLGDINLDGTVSAIDARMVLLATANLKQLTGKQVYSADLDGNGEITAIDARMILQKIVEE